MDANQKPAWRRVGEGRPIPGQSYKVLVPGEGGDAPFQEYAQYDTEWWCDSLGRAGICTQGKGIPLLRRAGNRPFFI